VKVKRAEKLIAALKEDWNKVVCDRVLTCEGMAIYNDATGIYNRKYAPVLKNLKESWRYCPYCGKEIKT
jgi:hypothetical protein